MNKKFTNICFWCGHTRKEHFNGWYKGYCSKLVCECRKWKNLTVKEFMKEKLNDAMAEAADSYETPNAWEYK